jgi:exosortase A-associated hydrolase 2
LTVARSETFYADVRGGRRFCILHQPDVGAVPRGTVVHVHAFAEEMNKSRRMVALAARALAATGWAVLLVDLDGCGDSSGDFGEATWSGWIEDVEFAQLWATERFGGPCWLWGLRGGCLVVAEANARACGRAPLLLWQPVLSGRLHLTQFLRLKLAGEALGGAEERTGVSALRARLARGASVEIAGYVLGPLLATGLERAELTLESQLAPVVWREVSAELEPSLAPASRARINGLQARGVAVDAIAVSGTSFWQTVEIAEAPMLVETTVAALGAADARVG